MENTLLNEFEKYLKLKDEKIEDLDEFSPAVALPLSFKVKSDVYLELDVREDNSVEVTNTILKNLNLNQNISPLKFIFHELIGNIYDHSLFKEAHVMGKSNQDYYEFGFMDDGITIPVSLKNNNFLFKNDCEAIIKAINGLSTKNKTGYIERGTGLNNTINITTNAFKGSVIIVSNGGLVYITHESIISRDIPKNSISGTMICLRMNVNKKIDIYKYLKQIKYDY